MFNENIRDLVAAHPTPAPIISFINIRTYSLCIMRRLWEWIKGEYKLWKLRREDPYIYEEDEYDED